LILIYKPVMIEGHEDWKSPSEVEKCPQALRSGPLEVCSIIPCGCLEAWIDGMRWCQRALCGEGVLGYNAHERFC
jgi:hypothetical protein